jgi:hypothetical protein
MGYELKEHYFYKHEDGSYRGCDIYHFLFEGHDIFVETNIRPDVLNGGYEFEILYYTEKNYEKIKIGYKIFKLYKILIEIYLKSFTELIEKIPDLPHLKICGFVSATTGEVIQDKRKVNIAINYIKKTLKIEKIFVDLKNNTIIVLDKTKLWKN